MISWDAIGGDNWTYVFDAGEDENDRAYDIAYGNDDRLYVAGVSHWEGDPGSDFHCLCLNLNGSVAYMQHFDGSHTNVDEANAVALGSDGNAYYAGYFTNTGQGRDFALLQLLPNGGLGWTRILDFENLNDLANDVCALSSDWVCAAGTYSTASGLRIGCLRAYRCSNPSDMWGLNLFRSGSTANDVARIAYCPATAMLYAVGSSIGSDGLDLAIYAVNTQTRQLVNSYHFDGAGTGDDVAYDVACDAQGNVYVAGTVTNSGTDTDFAVMCFSYTLEHRWTFIHDGPAGESDFAYCVAVGPDGNVYAAGDERAAQPQGSDLYIVSLAPDPTGVEGPRRSETRPGLSVKPSVGRALFTVQFDAPAVEVGVVDVAGRTVAKLDCDNAGRRAEWNATGVAVGVYVVQARTAAGMLQLRVVVVD